TEAIGVLGVKKAEDSDDLVIRLYERQGEEAEGVLSFSDPLAGCDRINGLEEILEDLTGSISSGGESVKIRIPANGLLSLRIRYRQGMVSSSAAAEPESLENHLELPLNETIFTPAGGTGVIPEDLRPEQIQGSGVLYQLRREGEGDCLRCDGQILSLPEGPGTRLSLLCAAEKDCTLPVVWLDREGRECGREEVSFQALTGRIGSWDTRIWKKTPRHADKMKRDYLWLNSCTGIEQGFVKRDRVEWFARRTLKDGRIQPYRYACLFSKNLMIPETAVSVKLPESGQVLLFAASTGGQQMRAEALTCLTDAYDF
ncbi:MAG: glycosyl hydrolase-related protein, partial [Spirochaetales bacterium]|nr:glycosyl hydrolase-related protein [Spirochaetales bacterium]